MVCNQWLRKKKKKHVSVGQENNLAWKLLMLFGSFSPQIMIKYYQIKPKDVARRRHTLAQSAHCTGCWQWQCWWNQWSRWPKWSGVKKNCPPHWRGTWVCQRLRCPPMLNGELWWIIIFGNRFFCIGDGIEKTSQDHLEQELPIDYILYQMIPPPGDTSSSTLSLATNV